jgi:CBS domain-containing protein
MLAKEIMHRKVIKVAPDMTLREVAKVFIDRHISGAPVVNHEGQLVGVVSQTDLVRQEREAAAAAEVPLYYVAHEPSYKRAGMHVEDPEFSRVRDVMTPKLISAEEDTPIRELARRMLRKRIHRIIITKRGKLSGIVTTSDMLKAWVGNGG